VGRCSAGLPESSYISLDGNQRRIDSCTLTQPNPDTDRQLLSGSRPVSLIFYYHLTSGWLIGDCVTALPWDKWIEDERRNRSSHRHERAKNPLHTFEAASSPPLKHLPPT